MLKRWSLLVILMFAALAFVGCSDDDSTTPPPAGDTAFDVMAAAGKAYLNDSAQCPGVISAQALFDNLEDYTVIDIRAESAYLAGHIPGAYNSSLTTLLADLANTIPSDKPYVVTCYSGQSAGHAKIAMEMMGYDDVYSLLFGMCSWNSTTRTGWDNNTNDLLANPETTDNNGDLVEHDFPVLTEDASTVVADRVAAMLTAGFKGVGYATIADNLEDYFVVNYFGQADYLGAGSVGVPGHIPGAYQFTPYASMGDDQMLNNLPSDGTPIVVYCWTGQHSSQVVAYLNMLGYNALSLSYGSNALFHSSLSANIWTSAQYHDFDMDMGPMMTGDFAALVEAGAAYIDDGTDCPGTISAAALNDALDAYTVIDIRGVADYNNGHIPGAYWSSLPTLLTDVGTTIPTDLPFVVTCYTGQGAGYAKFALEMMGYEDTKTLLWGMSSWSPDVTGTNWGTTTMVADLLGAPETTNNNIDLVWGSYPATTGDLATRVQAILTAGLQGVTYASIQDNLEDYFIINYFGEADYLGEGLAGVPGHIPGAFQFTPYASLGIGEMLAYLPTDKTIVTYCWTGQHSAQVTAYLNMLGYDAKTLYYGSNNLFHSSLTAHAWNASYVNDFTLEAVTN